MEFFTNFTKHLLCSLFLLTITSSCTSVLAQVVGGTPPPCDFAGLYNFGDANSDTGAISAAFLRIGPPNGVSFFGKPAGRICDGRLLIDFIAAHIGGLPYLGAFLDTINTDYRHGANFATGGSTIRRPNETIFQTGVSPFSFDIQTIQFTQFKARTIELYQQGKEITADKSDLLRPEYFSSALYTIDIGQNDLIAGFRTLTDQQLRAALPDIINDFATSVRRLYQVGARSFWIHNVGPIGCLPIQSLFHNPKPDLLDQYGCFKAQNDIVMEFNRQLKGRIVKLRSELSHAAITYVDVYTAKYLLISSTKSQGFNDPMKICCGKHENDLHVWCGHRANVGGTELFGDACPNPSAYVSWDGLHYSQAANHWVANLILNGSLSNPPIPITEACIKPK